MRSRPRSGRRGRAPVAMRVAVASSSSSRRSSLGARDRRGGGQAALGSGRRHRPHRALVEPSAADPRTGRPRDRAVPGRRGGAGRVCGRRSPRPGRPPDTVRVDVVEGPGVNGERLALAWAPRPDLPRIPGTPWGAVLIVFRGETDIAAKALPTTPFVRFLNVNVGGCQGPGSTGRTSSSSRASDGLRVLHRHGQRAALVAEGGRRAPPGDRAVEGGRGRDRVLPAVNPGGTGAARSV